MGYRTRTTCYTHKYMHRRIRREVVEIPVLYVSVGMPEGKLLTDTLGGPAHPYNSGGGTPNPGGGSSICWQDFVTLTCVYNPNTWGQRKNRMSICTSARQYVGLGRWTSATCQMLERWYPQTLNTVCHRR